MKLAEDFLLQEQQHNTKLLLVTFLIDFLKLR